MVFMVLFEHALGYALFDVVEFEEIGSMTPQVEAAIKDGSKFRKAVKLNIFRPFKDAAECRENTMAIAEGRMTEELQEFLSAKLESISKSDLTMGVVCPTLAAAIKDTFEIKATHTGVVPEIIRGIKNFLVGYLVGVTNEGRAAAELGLGHSFSRSKVQYNVNRVDNMMIQSIASIDQMDKNLNMFSMRLREWYSYHFPELSKLIDDHQIYARLVLLFKERTSICEEMLPQIEEIVQDETKAHNILRASQMSMGTEILKGDLDNIEFFAGRVIALSECRKEMTLYLKQTVQNVSPNVGEIIGDTLAARLISKAGSLTNLAKMPACTVQILGAEKALFRAIKTKSATPKYGMLYHASFMSRAGKTDKGRISRCLANKVSLAAKIDCFSDKLTNEFGKMMKQQVEDRLTFYDSGTIPPKNEEIMCLADAAHKSALKAIKKTSKKRKSEVNGNGKDDSEPTPKKKKSKQNGSMIAEPEVEQTEEVVSEKKKKKKKRQTISCADEVTEEVEAVDTSINAEKKKKKKKKRESV